MDKKKKTILIIGIIIILLIAAFLIYWLVIKQTPEETPVVKNEVEIDGDKVVLDVGGNKQELIKAEKPTAEAVAQASLEVEAKNFVERFGTFSNHSNFVNLEELLPKMTPNFANWVKNSYMVKLKEDYDVNGSLYKITTFAPVAYIDEQTDTTAKITLQTSRTEVLGFGTENTFRQDVTMDLVKQNNEWLVDALYWQDKQTN